MTNRNKVEEIFNRHGITDFRWVSGDNVVVAQWVRFKCMFGCPSYGRTGTCPPQAPDVGECERFFREYDSIAILHFNKKVEKPEDRFKYSGSLPF